MARKRESKSNDEALLHYKLTGERGSYVDPVRDQEADIAPERGVSPHPELENPRAPDVGPFAGVNLKPEDNPVLRTPEEKEKAAESKADEPSEGPLVPEGDARAGE